MKNQRLPSIATIISLIVILSTGIWAGSKIDSKAEEAHEYIKENKFIPLRVKTLEKKMEHVEGVLENLDVIQDRQQRLTDDLNKIVDKIKEK